MNPTLSHGLGNDSVVKLRGSAMLRGNDFCNNRVTVRHKDSLSTRRKTNIFTQFVLQHFDSNGLHFDKVALGSYRCQFTWSSNEDW